MTVSAVNICNYALQEIGEESIISLADNTVQAQQCNLRYDSVRRAVLEDGNWNFALKRASLPLTNETDVFADYNNIFALPSDCLRVVMTDKEMQTSLGSDPYFNGYKTIGFSGAYSGRDRYKVEGRRLLYDDDTAKILYISDFKDTTKFSPLFTEATSLLLSSRIAYKITGSRSLAQEKEQAYTKLIYAAKLRDSQQGTTERQDVSRFLSARR